MQTNDKTVTLIKKYVQDLKVGDVVFAKFKFGSTDFRYMAIEVESVHVQGVDVAVIEKIKGDYFPLGEMNDIVSVIGAKP